MDGADPSLCTPDKEEDDEEVDSLFRVRLADAPILLFVCFHKAIRAELAQLRRLVETASLENKSQNQELILKLKERFEFLKLVLNYHCAAEDEVIFLALDVHVKNVVCTYYLEHKSTDDLFNSIFRCLDELMDPKDNISKLFQEFAHCIDILQTSICQHMLKEEKQVFPLLMHKLSPKEQASLVWQFICGVPIILLEEVLPWMTSFLSANKQAELKECLKEISPMEKPLQEVLISWLNGNNLAFTELYFKREGVQCADESVDMTASLGLHFYNGNFKKLSNWMKANCQEREDGVNQVNVLSIWHGVIKKDIKEILEDLYQIRSSSAFQNLDSILVQLKFFVDVLTFYNNAQKTFFYPVLSKLCYSWLSKSTEQFLSESHIEDLQRLLSYSNESSMPLCKFIEKLCRELELFVIGVSKHLSFLETEVFPVISKYYSGGMQERLLGLNLYMMPLGLLKCVITWFAAHLSENESRSTLFHIEHGNPLFHKSFASLLHEWFRVGYSGKTSIDKFRQELQHTFKIQRFLLPEQIESAAGFSFLNSNKQLHNGSIISGKKSLSHSSSSGSDKVDKFVTPYAAGINLNLFFPATVMKLHPSLKFHAANSCSMSFLDNPQQIDLIFFFHKAIKKDLDYLVLGSAQLDENAGLLMDFHKRFRLICFLHQIHSDAEDEIVFPALEAKGKLKNISHSYSIDHELEVEHVSKISCILDKMADLHLSVTIIDNTWKQRMVKYHQLCRKIQGKCKSMHKLLCDHIHREETEIWPVIREFFSNEEQRKIIGCILGRLGAEILQDMIPWLMSSLTQKEQHILMFLWSMATKNTMFDEWLGEWWDGYSISKATKVSKEPPPQTVEPLEIASEYLCEEVLDEIQVECPPNRGTHIGDDGDLSQNCTLDTKDMVHDEEQENNECSESINLLHDNSKHACYETKTEMAPVNKNPGHYDHLLKMSQDDMRQQISFSEATVASDGPEFPGQHPSYRDPLKLIYGCKHYQRKCKLFASCCNKLYTCIRCHDEVSDHSIDRKSITKMMCMSCLVIQPITATCSTVSCNNLSMARYYCRICRLFDDTREIYHCPYCNLCRVGKGLGVEYFHCMNCNACMSRALAVHICREKSLEDNCPICYEYIFTSSNPVKALPCGHAMHSTCFEEYTSFNYTCPICGKSLGDMQVYFGMLDALLAEEKVSDEFSSQCQAILCHDCEKKGEASFHWLYHKCPSCGSYNTRVL
ncbi:hypothetical protein L6164_011127 [Bauhinia variegata]|uniref:Uncharacterized protein n=1 Tax=Bauhinia variegata TaxID=167791 RepID=A0ACB9P634_BAUVA|nr:hypothetical protein L6164_011127 [Bauhinia variegata]